MDIWLPLTTLIISENRLKELPSKLPLALITLDVSANDINRLPLYLPLLKRLKIINWEKNPIQFPPREILSKGIASTMYCLKEFLTAQLPNETIKLLFVGRKHAGKTTLTNALKSADGKVTNFDQITKTDGVDIEVKKINAVEFKMFDLAGDDNYLETHAMFIC